jgi:hypothetical protein
VVYEASHAALLLGTQHIPAQHDKHNTWRSAQLSNFYKKARSNHDASKQKRIHAMKGLSTATGHCSLSRLLSMLIDTWLPHSKKPLASALLATALHPCKKHVHTQQGFQASIVTLPNASASPSP